MRRLLISSFIAVTSLSLASTTLADPPAHAPAHGWRAKHARHAHPPPRTVAGFEVAFDPVRSVSIVVDMPGVYVHAGHFYRWHAGVWQTSIRADGGWVGVSLDATPDAIRKAHRHHSPAKIAPKLKAKRKKH